MPSTSTSRTVTGLTNGTSYLFRVAGVNHTVGDFVTSSAVTPGANPPIILSGNTSFVTGGSLNGTWEYAGTYNGKAYYSKQIQWTAEAGFFDVPGYIYFVPTGWYISAQLGRTTQAGPGPSQILFCKVDGSDAETPVFSPWSNVVANGTIVTVSGT